MIFSVLRNPEGENYTFAEVLGPIKGYTAHTINKQMKRHGQVWQDESFDHVLRSDEKLEVRVEYLRQNPVRRGLVKIPEQYRWLWAEHT